MQRRNYRAFENMFAAPEVIAFQRRQLAARLFENQSAGRVIPQFLAAVYINIVTAGSQITPIERTAAEAADGAEGRERVHTA